MSTPEQNKVLVIDDDEMVLTIVRKMLEAEMFSVDVCLSARDALKRLPETRYSAILCDMWMPGMTGKDFYNQLRKQYPEYLSRIIFLTGDIASEATWDFIEERHLPYVLKPVNPPELRRKIQEVVGLPEGAPAPAKKGAEARRHKRVAMKASVRVTKKKWATGGPDIAAVVNASKDGVLFMSDRQYRVGMDVLVAFPYTGSNDVDQDAVVVRVDERSDGRRGVAVAIGESASMARSAIGVSDEQKQRDRILAMADMSGVASARVVASAAAIDAVPSSDAAVQLARARDDVARMTQEISNLKMVCDRAAAERDRLASLEGDYKQEARELRSANAALNQTINELKREVERVRNEMEAALASRAEAEAELRGVRQELEKTREQDEAIRARETVRSLEASRPAAAQTAPATAVSTAADEQLAELQGRLQEFRTAGVGPLTILGAYCDMLAMNKSLDEGTRQTIEEISQQAAQLRNSFQKLFKK